MEQAGYISRSRERKENGQLGGAEYVIHEQPPEDIRKAFIKYLQTSVDKQRSNVLDFLYGLMN